MLVKKLRIVKVGGANNLADLFTKTLPVVDIEKHLSTLGFRSESGRPNAVPRIYFGRGRPRP